VNGGEESVLVEAVDSIKNRADDGNRVVLSKLSLCEDTVKELSAGGEVERKVRFCARLEALVKLDLGWVRMSWVGTERETDRRCLSRRWLRFPLFFS